MIDIKFSILSRQEAIQYSHDKNNQEAVIIISITDVENKPVRFSSNANIIASLHLIFDDVYGDEANHMSIDDARKIINFYKDYKDIVSTCIVHCEAGISRSSAIAAALMTIDKQEDMDIFENPKYAPNKHCYYTLLNTYYGSFPEQEHKFVANIEAYRKAEGLDNEEETEDPRYWSTNIIW